MLRIALGMGWAPGGLASVSPPLAPQPFLNPLLTPQGDQSFGKYRFQVSQLGLALQNPYSVDCLAHWTEMQFCIRVISVRFDNQHTSTFQMTINMGYSTSSWCDNRRKLIPFRFVTCGGSEKSRLQQPSNFAPNYPQPNIPIGRAIRLGNGANWT